MMSALGARSAGFILALIGLCFIVAPCVTGGRIPGDIGDARFNSYLLEHFYRWLLGHDHGFWTADFFYPFPLTVAFSDNYLGNGIIYALFRALGLGRIDAFRLWFVAGYIVNFAAADYALTRLGFSRIAAAVGAFLFTFGLPMNSQEYHAQLVYRFGVPLTVLYLEEFRRRGELQMLAWATFWVTWQFYCSIYIGYFLCLLLAALLAGHLLCGERFRLTQRWQEASWPQRKRFIVIMAILAMLLVILYAPYVEASHLYGLRRPWSETSEMLPRPASFLLTHFSRLWPASWWLFDSLPMQQEQAMFIGAAPFLIVGIAAALRASGRAALDQLVAPAALSILAIVLLTLCVHGVSLYRSIAWLPGANAIRAVARIIVVLLFPCALLVAASLDAIRSALLPAWLRHATRAILIVLLVLEASYVSHYTSTAREWRARMTAITAQLPSVLPQNPILLIGPGPDPAKSWRHEMDAMMFAQDRGWRTLNGYSGNQPPRHALTGTCGDAPLFLATGLRFIGRSQMYDNIIRQVVLLGYPACEATLLHEPHVTSLAGPVPRSLAANIRLHIESLVVRNGHIVITATITNGSAAVLPAASTTNMPIRLSARFVNEHDTQADLRAEPGWDSRQDLASDVRPGATQSVEMSLQPPSTPGTYRVALSMVQEGVAWFHNGGMPIPVSTETIAVDASGHVSDHAGLP